MVKVKVCGIKTLEDAQLCIERGAEFLGFNFWTGTKRMVELGTAQKIIKEIRGKAELVGVFVNQNLAMVNEVAKLLGLDWVQLHGDEPPEYCKKVKAPVIKALRLGREEDLKLIEDYPNLLWLVDSKTEKYGGSGISPDWNLARKAKERIGKIFLAGGLTPENVRQAINTVQPWAVDVASGVESSPGVKDGERLKKFFEAVKSASG